MIPAVIDLRLRFFEKARDAAGCRATAEMWERLSPADPPSMYRAAIMRAVTAAVLSPEDPAGGAAESDRAMAWLRKAAAAAGFRDIPDPRQNNDFRVLRDRDDFKQLLSELRVHGEKK
jgi:hypothetical protein